jgi:hypothetical protein
MILIKTTGAKAPISGTDLNRFLKKGVAPLDDGLLVADEWASPEDAVWAILGNKVFKASSPQGDEVRAAFQAARTLETTTGVVVEDEGESPYEARMRRMRASEAHQKEMSSLVLDAPEEGLHEAWVNWVRVLPEWAARSSYREDYDQASKDAWIALIAAAEAAGALRLDDSAPEEGQVRLLHAGTSRMYKGHSQPVALVRVKEVMEYKALEANLVLEVLHSVRDGVVNVIKAHDRDIRGTTWADPGLGVGRFTAHREMMDSLAVSVDRNAD